MVTQDEITIFAGLVQKKLAEYHASRRNHGAAPRIEVMFGPKYARLVLEQGPSRSAYGFVEFETGDILKADGWKRPAKHARGNISASDPLACCGPYGMEYLR